MQLPENAVETAEQQLAAPLAPDPERLAEAIDAYVLGVIAAVPPEPPRTVTYDDLLRIMAEIEANAARPWYPEPLFVGDDYRRVRDYYGLHFPVIQRPRLPMITDVT
jgi:hypothetical protein